VHRYSIIACARWETPYIAEWIAYYEVIGFDHIYLYCNDDDPAELLAEVQNATRHRPDFVSFRHFSGQGRQQDMYIAAMERARFETEWVTFLDIDEFLVLRDCDDIRTFMRLVDPSVDSVHFNWVYFGNSGHVERPAGSVLRHYTWRSPQVNAWNKHLTRASLLTADKLQQPSLPFWHALGDPIWSNLKRVNILGADMAPLLANFPGSEGKYLSNPAVSQAIFAKAIVNHYALKSEADFMLRVARGLGAQFYAQTIWQTAYENGSYRTILSEMSQIEDTYLHDFSYRVFGDRLARPLRKDPAPPIDTVTAENDWWIGNLQLGSNRRLRHVTHGWLADYTLDGDILGVAWDEYPPEKFVRLHGLFRSV
jgi:Glycosyl transferase family 2